MKLVKINQFTPSSVVCSVGRVGIDAIDSAYVLMHRAGRRTAGIPLTVQIREIFR